MVITNDRNSVEVNTGLTSGLRFSRSDSSEAAIQVQTVSVSQISGDAER